MQLELPDSVVKNIEDGVNIFEAIDRSLSIEDDYLRMILAVNIMQFGLQKSSSDVDNLPEGTVGKSLSSIGDNQTGDAMFPINGRRVVAEVISENSEIESGRYVEIVGPGNSVVEATSEKESASKELAGGGLEGGIDALAFNVADTRDENLPDGVTTNSQGEVELSPGEESALIRINAGSGGLLWREVGTNDEDETQYQYVVDDEPVNPQPMNQALGRYNNLYRFPEPLEVEEFFEVRVSRLSSATGDQPYVTKVSYTT